MTPVPLRSVPRTTVEGWPGLTAASILTTAGGAPLANSGGAPMTAPPRVMTSAAYLSHFAEGFEVLSRIPPGVAIFGSSRATRHDPYYGVAEGIGRLLAQHGFAVLTGAGPGIMG